MLNKRDQKKYDYALKRLPMNRFLIGSESRTVEYLEKIIEDCNRTKQHRQQAKSILYMYEMITRETGLTDIVEIQKYWCQESYLLCGKPKREKKSNRDPSSYNYMPKPDRRDNKHTRVGSGSGGSNTIRYPKKVRKTAWKRFYKLFPKLDPKNKKEEQ